MGLKSQIDRWYKTSKNSRVPVALQHHTILTTSFHFSFPFFLKPVVVRVAPAALAVADEVPLDAVLLRVAVLLVAENKLPPRAA